MFTFFSVSIMVTDFGLLCVCVCVCVGGGGGGWRGGWRGRGEGEVDGSRWEGGCMCWQQPFSDAKAHDTFVQLQPLLDA